MTLQSLTPAGAAASYEPAPAGAAAAPASSFHGALAAAASKSSADTPDRVLDAKKAPKGETSRPVEGHRYADILSGPRNGMYLNTSGNKRHGMAFVLVKRDGKEYHVYGSGKDRLVVCLKRKPQTDAPAKAKPETATPRTDTAPSGTTGAAAAISPRPAEARGL